MAGGGGAATCCRPPGGSADAVEPRLRSRSRVWGGGSRARSSARPAGAAPARSYLEPSPARGEPPRAGERRPLRVASSRWLGAASGGRPGRSVRLDGAAALPPASRPGWRKKPLTGGGLGGRGRRAGGWHEGAGAPVRLASRAPPHRHRHVRPPPEARSRARVSGRPPTLRGGLERGCEPAPRVSPVCCVRGGRVWLGGGGARRNRLQLDPGRGRSSAKEGARRLGYPRAAGTEVRGCVWLRLFPKAPDPTQGGSPAAVAPRPPITGKKMLSSASASAAPRQRERRSGGFKARRTSGPQPGRRARAESRAAGRWPAKCATPARVGSKPSLFSR